MTNETWFSKEIAKIEDDLDFVVEEMAFDYVNEIRRVMKEQNISQSELANRIGKSRAYVSKVLNYSPNMTIRSLAMIVLALDIRSRWTRPRMVDKAQVDRLDTLVMNNSNGIMMESYKLDTPASNAIPADCLVAENEAEYRVKE